MANPSTTEAPRLTGHALLRRLTGRWTIARAVSNGARLQGTASFTQCNDGLFAYREDGRLFLPDGQSFAATRGYLYEPFDDGFRVTFAEPPHGLFHAVSLEADGGGWIGDAHHWCRSDFYRTQYAFTADDSFAITHAVKGPRHDYTMATQYRR